MLEQSIFYFFAVLLVLAASMVITVRNPVHAVLFLVLSFFSSAAIWLLLEAEFLAITLVLVYVGAVMVLFLFVVMMLDINLAPLREGFVRHLPLGITVALLMVILMGAAIRSGVFEAETLNVGMQHGPAYNNTRELGQALYTSFLYPFEIAGAILLVAIIAAIALTMRKPRSVKTPKPEWQVNVRPEQRVRLVEMDSRTQEK